MGTDPSAADNAWLHEAADHQIPFIYLLGVSPGRYQATIPTFVVDCDPRRLIARIAFGALAGATATACQGQLRLAPSGQMIGIDMNAALKIGAARGCDLAVLSELLPAAEAGLVDAVYADGVRDETRCGR